MSDNIIYRCTEIYDNEVRLPDGRMISRYEYQRLTGFPVDRPRHEIEREVRMNPFGTVT